jgi:hypothetical protein
MTVLCVTSCRTIPASFASYFACVMFSNLPQHGWTALPAAASGGYADVVALLVGHCNINTVDEVRPITIF